MSYLFTAAITLCLVYKMRTDTQGDMHPCVNLKGVQTTSGRPGFFSLCWIAPSVSVRSDQILKYNFLSWRPTVRVLP